MTPPDRTPLNAADRGDAVKQAFRGDLYGEQYLASELARSELAVRRPGEPIVRYLPGLGVVGVAAGASAWLAEHYGFPIILLGLLVGLALNFVAQERKVHPGLELLSQSGLRWGIVMLGFQVTLAQIAQLGIWPFVALVGIMGATFAAGLGGAVMAGQSRYAGILAGGATAICGASAALALYGIIGRDRLSQAQFALTLVGVSLASALAMSLYPALAGELGLSDQQAGFLIGASIHDVAQAIGGGFTYSDAAGAEATIIKLSRVALLGPAMILVALWVGRPSEGETRPPWRRAALPWFIVGFVVLVLVNSTGAVPAAVREVTMAGSKALLLFAVIATAMRSDMSLMMKLGWRALAPIAAATVASFTCALAAVWLGAA